MGRHLAQLAFLEVALHRLLALVVVGVPRGRHRRALQRRDGEGGQLVLGRHLARLVARRAREAHAVGDEAQVEHHRRRLELGAVALVVQHLRRRRAWRRCRGEGGGGEAGGSEGRPRRCARCRSSRRRSSTCTARARTCAASRCPPCRRPRRPAAPPPPPRPRPRRPPRPRPRAAPKCRSARARPPCAVAPPRSRSGRQPPCGCSRPRARTSAGSPAGRRRAPAPRGMAMGLAACAHKAAARRLCAAAAPAPSRN